jgi:hypothetical protein
MAPLSLQGSHREPKQSHNGSEQTTQSHYLSQTSKIASLEFTLNEVNVLAMTVCGMITSLALQSEGKCTNELT